MANKDTLEQIELRSEEVQEILTKVPHWMIRWGNSLFLALIAIVIFISWMVKYPEILEAQAILTTFNPPQKLYAKVGGKIEDILIIENEEVKPNQPLAVIENPASFQDVSYLSQILDTLDIRDKNILFPFEEMPILFLGSIEADYAQFVNTYLEFSLHRELNPYQSQKLANRVSLSEAKRRLQVLENQKELEEASLSFQQKGLRRDETLFEKGVISEDEFEKKKIEFNQAQQNHKNLEASISQMRENIAAAKNVSQGTLIEQTVKQETLQKALILSYNQLRTAIKNWEQLYVMKAQIVGSVSFSSYWSKNQTVEQGDLVFTVLPQNQGSYLAKLLVPARNSGKLEIGQHTTLELDRYPEEEYGVLEGTVNNISALPDKEGFYHVDVGFPDFQENLITSYGKELIFQQEMTGSAKVNTEELRLIERLFYQFKNAIKR